jgi:cytoskeletal protein CcmA (bactofilin family)
VTGEIHAGTLVIQEGALVDGLVRMGQGGAMENSPATEGPKETTK